MKINNAVICAAGFGSRLGLDIPKCLVQLGKHKLIYYLLDLLKDVSNIRVVVGYKEEEVINYVTNIRNDVLFVRNPDYAKTSNSYSLYLGSKDLTEPFISLDGDLIISKESFKKFINNCNPTDDLLGITFAKTDDAVFTKINEKSEILKFSREKISPYEWTGIAYLSNIKITAEQVYIFEQLDKYLPLKASLLDCWEIDTPNDLQTALNNIPFLD